MSVYRRIRIGDLVSVLSLDFAEEARKAIQRLPLKDKADLPNERRSFFVCPECGDLGCGAATAIVVKEGDTVSWRNFGHQNNYEDAVLPDSYKNVGPLTFDAAQYERTLLQVRLQFGLPIKGSNRKQLGRRRCSRGRRSGPSNRQR